jgi:hypothetical protein
MTRHSTPIAEDTTLGVGVTVMALYKREGKESVWLKGVTVAQREGISEPEGGIPVEYEVKFNDGEVCWISAWDLKRKTTSTPAIGHMVNLTPSSPEHAVAKSKKITRPENDPVTSVEENSSPKKKTKKKGKKQPWSEIVVTSSY